MRRVAYGPGTDPQARAEAGAALHALEQQTVRESEPAAAESESEQQSHGMRPVWLIPIVVAALGVGALGALGVTGQLGGGLASVAPSESPSTGYLEAADRWFEVKAGPLDVFPNPGMLEDNFIDPANVRFLAEQESDRVAVFASKNTSWGEICLLAAFDSVLGSGGGTGIGCTSRDEFATHGIAFGANGVIVEWKGDGVTVERNAS